jgi:hypothetical protein
MRDVFPQAVLDFQKNKKTALIDLNFLYSAPGEISRIAVGQTPNSDFKEPSSVA